MKISRWLILARRRGSSCVARRCRREAIRECSGVGRYRLGGLRWIADEVSFAVVLAASSSSFSTRTRISAPRLVRTGGGPGLMSGGFGRAIGRDSRGSSRRRSICSRADVLDLLDLDPLMRRHHDVVPGSAPAASRRSCGWSASNRHCPYQTAQTKLPVYPTNQASR